MKTLYESIISNTNIGIKSKISKWLDKYTSCTIDMCDIDMNGFIHVNADLVFNNNSANLDSLPDYIKFSEVDGCVYSLPKCHWKTFNGFPKTVATVSKGFFVMSTDSDVIDYMPEVIHKSPHAKHPIEISFSKAIKECKVDIPKDTIIKLDYIMTEEECVNTLNMLKEHADGNITVSTHVSHKTIHGHSVNDFTYIINNKGAVR